MKNIAPWLKLVVFASGLSLMTNGLARFASADEVDEVKAAVTILICDFKKASNVPGAAEQTKVALQFQEDQKALISRYGRAAVDAAALSLMADAQSGEPTCPETQ